MIIYAFMKYYFDEEGQKPSDTKNDYVERWGLDYLYDYHPKGKREGFYEEILDAIYQRRNERMRSNL